MRLLGTKLTPRSIVMILGSLLAGVGLIVLLLRASSVRWQEVLGRSLAVDRMAFIRLSLLVALSSVLSSEKWRMTDRVISRGFANPLPRATAFGLTALGVALGQFLPIQVSMSVTRTLGTMFHRRPLRRGTVATLFEQAFDLLVTILMIAAAACTRLWHGGAAMWLLFAVFGALLVVSGVGILMGLVSRLATRVSSLRICPARWRKVLTELQQSGLFEANLARPLTLISVARFAILVLMSSQVSSGIHIAIPLWRLAAAIPFGLLAAAAGITPGGLGIAEAANAAVLNWCGLPLALSTQWAIANRLLSSAAVFAVAGLSVILLLAFKSLERLRPQSPNTDMAA